VIHGLRVNVPAVEKVAADEREVNAVGDGVLLNHVSPCAEEIFRALFHVVTAAAQMYVRYVKKLHNPYYTLLNEMKAKKETAS
jgi:hypothetical protein